MRDRVCIWHTCLFLTQILLYPSVHIFADILDLCPASTRTPGANGLSETSRLVQIYTCDIVNQTVTHKHAMSTESTHNRNWIAPCLSIGFALSQLWPAAFATLYFSERNVAYKTRNYVNFTDNPLYMSNAARPMRSSSAKARGKFWELEEAEIIPRESLRWYLCGM